MGDCFYRQNSLLQVVTMTVHNILKMGSKSLQVRSIEVHEFATLELFSLINDMKTTMEEKGGVGLAAPQIGYNKRIVIFGFEKNHRYPNDLPVPFTTLINPLVKIISNEIEDSFEGCLSIPGMRGLVPRYKKIKYSGFDEHGNHISKIAEGFHARIVQHEVDHLDGVLYPFRIKDLRNFGYEESIDW